MSGFFNVMLSFIFCYLLLTIVAIAVRIRRKYEYNKYILWCDIWGPCAWLLIYLIIQVPIGISNHSIATRTIVLPMFALFWVTLSTSRDFRNASIRMLFQSREPKIVPPLAPTLHRTTKDEFNRLMKTTYHGDPQARMYAIKELKRIGDSQAVPDMLHLLKDSNRSVRFEAAKVIVYLDGLRAIKPLLESLQDVSLVRKGVEIRTALNKIGNARSLPLTVLEDPVLTPEEKLDTIDAMRRQHTLFILPNVADYCRTILAEPNATPDRKQIMQAILNELELRNGSQTLLRPSAPDSELEKARLLRPAGTGIEDSEGLLRPVGNTED